MDQELAAWLQQLKGLTWRKAVWWSHRDLCRLGIDMLNLLCAKGLPGAERMNIDLCLRKIDQWADKVKSYTSSMVRVFVRQPEQFGHSKGYFQALCLVTCLQRECGVRFNPAKRDPDAHIDVADSFIFGIIQGDGGTCASLPVLYCAVGHRLLYPMYLVHTNGGSARHTFVGWDDGEVRFNIEATAEGMGTPDDDHYRTGRFQITPEIERRGRFLKPNNMRQSLAGFLAERAVHCRDASAYQEAVESMGWAAALHPENEFYLNTARMYYNDWVRRWNEKKPPGFPPIYITRVDKRRFAPTIPMEFELNVYGVETTERLLKDKEHDRKLWEPLRRGQKPSRVPFEVEVEVDKDGGKRIRFLFEKKAPHRGGGCFDV
jgi:hypothetical protein